jgi:hypothetical protein
MTGYKGNRVLKYILEFFSFPCLSGSVINFSITLFLLEHEGWSPLKSFGRHGSFYLIVVPMIAITAVISPSGVEICLVSQNILVPLVWAVPQVRVWLQLPLPSVVELPDMTSLLPQAPRDLPCNTDNQL